MQLLILHATFQAVSSGGEIRVRMVRCCSKKLLSYLHALMQVVKIQPQIFKSSYIKLIVLLWSLIYSLLSDILIAITIVSAILTVFIILGVVYLITAIVYILIRNVRKDYKCLKVIWLVDIAYLIGGIFYYVGRNFPPLQSILLGTVVLLYRFIPFFISKYYQSNLAKEHQTTEAKLQLVPEWILAAESLTLLVEFDALYTVILNSFPSSLTLNFCVSEAPSIAAWVLWAVFVLMYISILYYTMNIQYCGNCNINWSCVTSNFGAIIALAAFGMYLLAYNTYPLYCSGVNLLIARRVMRILVLIVVITAIVLLLVYRCLPKTRQEKLLPHALYQQLHPDHDDEQNYVPLESITMQS